MNSMDIDDNVVNSDTSSDINGMFDKEAKWIKPRDYKRYEWNALTHHNSWLIEDKLTKLKYYNVEKTNIDECERCHELTIRNYKSWHQNMIFCRKHGRWIHWKCTGKSYEYLVACAKGENRFDCC